MSSPPPFDMPSDQRRRSLVAAREALNSGSDDAMRLALASLPPDGEKGARLRAALTLRIAHPTAEKQPRSAVDLSSLGFGVSLWEGGLASLLETRVHGGTVELRVNRDHPCFTHIATVNGDGIEPAAALLLMGWASLEVEAGGGRRSDQIQRMLDDWSLSVGRLARSLGEEL